MEINTKDLIGDALDWAVTKCEGLNAQALVELAKRVPGKSCGYFLKKYSTDWLQGGLIIDREKISLVWSIDHWHAYKLFNYYNSFNGRDNYHPLIAVMRCYVASKLGDTVDVPEELLK